MDIETQEQTQDAGDGYAEATDADLIAAAQEAGGAASVDVDAEAAAAGAPPVLATAADQASAGGELEEPKIAAVIRAREAAAKQRFEAEDYAAQTRQQAAAEAEQIRAEARAQAQRDHQAYLEAQRKQFAESPTEYLRALAKDPQDVVDAVIRDGTAEGRAMRAIREQLAEANKKAGVAEQVKSEFDAWKQQLQTEKQAAFVEQVKHGFMTSHASPEKAPYLHRRYDADEIFDKANRLATQWQRAGVAFDHGDVAQYLEFESRKRILGDAAGAPPQQVSGVSGNASKVRAPGSRTLSAANGSERRASPKPIDEMTPEEERAALIEAVREARRQSGG